MKQPTEFSFFTKCLAVSFISNAIWKVCFKPWEKQRKCLGIILTVCNGAQANFEVTYYQKNLMWAVVEWFGDHPCITVKPYILQKCCCCWKDISNCRTRPKVLISSFRYYKFLSLLNFKRFFRGLVSNRQPFLKDRLLAVF